MKPASTTLELPAIFLFGAAADYVFRRVMEDNVSEGNCRLHGLHAAQEAWRQFKSHNPGPELEGMMASWLTESGLRDYDLKDNVYRLLFGPDHKWVRWDDDDTDAIIEKARRKSRAGDHKDMAELLKNAPPYKPELRWGDEDGT